MTGSDHYLCACCQGNINFATGADQEHAIVSNRQDLVDLARLLSVETEALEKALLSRVIAAGGHVVEKQLNVHDSLYARNAFAKVRVLSRRSFVFCRFGAWTGYA